MVSLKKITAELEPHIIALQETNLKNEEKLSLPGYVWIEGNRKWQDGGGVGFLLLQSVVKNITREPTTSLPDKMELRWIRIILTDNQQLCIGVFYGKQESYSSENTQNEYTYLQNTISSYIAQGTHVIILDDFNAKVGNDNCGVPGNDPTVSRNGRMLRQLIESSFMVLGNASPVCKGIWTRVNSQKTSEKSVLDYVLFSPSLTQSVTNMVIDEQEYYKFHSPRKKSDHNTFIVELQLTFNPIKISNPMPASWKIQDKTDWISFNNSAALSPIINNSYPGIGESSTSFVTKWVASLHAIATEIIGKRTIGKPRRPFKDDPEIEAALCAKKDAKESYIASLRNNIHDPALLNKYQETKSDLNNVFLSKEADVIDAKLKLIVNNGGINSRNFWGIRRKLVRNSLEDLHAVKNDKGVRLFHPEETKDFTADYYEGLLTPQQASNFNSVWTKCIENLNSIRLTLDVDGDLPHNLGLRLEETVNASLQLKGNKSCGPDLIPNEFFIHSDVICTSAHRIFCHVFDNEDIPSQWCDGTMINLSKGKGDCEVLTNKRGITLTSNVGKLFERVINNRLLKVLTFSEAQAGGRPERAPVDQLFILYEVLKQRKSEGKQTFCAFLDVHKAYDQAWRGVIFHILWESGIRGKLWRILIKLNSDIVVQIATRFGLTRVINVYGGVKQGGVLSVAQFARMIDELEAELKKEGLGVEFLGLLIACLLFVDDIILMADSADELQEMLDLSYKLFSKLHLKISQSKSQVIVFNKKAATKMRTWTFGALVLDEVIKYKYLGHIITHNLSIHDDIQHKNSLVEAAIATCLSVASDAVLQHMKAETLLHLYSACILAIILYGTEIYPESGIEALEVLQNKCLKRLLKLPSSTPNAAILMETGNLPIRTLVHRRQLGYYHKLKSRPTTLVGQILVAQERSAPPLVYSWCHQMESLLKMYGTKFEENVTYNTWKEAIRKTTRMNGQESVLESAATLSKTSALSQVKSTIYKENYFSILPYSRAVLFFKARCRMLNFSNNFRGNSVASECGLCHKGIESDEHIFDECTELLSIRDSLRIRITNVFNEDTSAEGIIAISEFLATVQNRLRRL